MKSFVFILAVGCMLVAASTGMAGTVMAVGDLSGTDWSQQWYDTGPLNIVQIEPQAPDLLALPGLSNASVPGSLVVNTTTAVEFVATSVTPDIYINTNFQAAAPVEGTTFYWQTFDGSTLNDDVKLVYDPQNLLPTNVPGYYNPGGGWYGIQSLTVQENPIVPEPVSMIFFATGLVGIGGYMTRRRMLRAA